MKKYLFVAVAAAMFALSALGFRSAQAEFPPPTTPSVFPSVSVSMLTGESGNAAMTNRAYDRYMLSVQGGGSSEGFILDQKAYNDVQAIFDSYLRKRIARTDLNSYDTIDIMAAGSRWSLERWLIYLLQQGTILGQGMAAAEAGLSRADHEKIMDTYTEDEFRFAEAFWKATGRLMVKHARDYYNVPVTRLRAVLVHTKFNTYYGDYFNPGFLNIRFFLDQAARNYAMKGSALR